MSELEYSVKDKIATLRMNRPEKKNSFTVAMLRIWKERLYEAQADPDVRVIVITGTGDAFCSGGDMSRRTNEGDAPPTVLERKEGVQRGPQSIGVAMLDIDKPVMAAVNGVAVGAGMDMALMCDIRVATRSARFSEGYIRMGLVPGNGASYFLPRLVGVGKALELLWTGEFIDSAEAERLGILNHVFEDAEFEEKTYALAARIAASSPIVARAIKRTVYQSQQTDLRTSLELISSHMAIVNSTDDYREAIAAYKEKRSPVYQGK